MQSSRSRSMTGRLFIRGIRLANPLPRGSDSRIYDITIVDGIVSDLSTARDVFNADPDADLVIDADGMIAVPGLVNAHDHLYSHELRHPLPGLDIGKMRELLDSRPDAETLFTMLGAAQDELSRGITLIRDLGAISGLNTTLARLLDQRLVDGPTIVASGRPIVMTGGHVWTFGREADGPWDCRRAVREQARAGAQVIKIMGSGGLSHYPDEDFTIEQFTDEELAATIDEAHRVGLPTASHVFGAAAVARVVRLGIDCVEHGVSIDDETLAVMAERGTFYVPTLSNMERIASSEYNELSRTPERSEVLTAGVVGPHRETVRRAIAAGVRIAVGTDSTGNYADELARLSSLGMNAEETLTAATANGADICRQPAGRIAIGLRADLTLHTRDPRESIEDLISPDYVICRGIVMKFPM